MSEADSPGDLEWIYEVVLQIIISPEFRSIIKDFVDENCGTFIGVEENTFEQGALHREFIQLVDNLLETLSKEMGITEEMFCMAAKKGLNDSKVKKYFEQLISFTNYNYFKNLMTKRNFQLEKQAYKQMMEDKDNKEDEENEEELEKKTKEMEENELQCALKMSLAAEEELKKLAELEDEDLKKAIELSLKEQKAKDEPTPLVQMQLPSKKGEETKPKPKKEEPKKMEEPKPKSEPSKEDEKKLNPVDKVALKQKLLQEHDEKIKNTPKINFTAAGNESLNKKLNELEQNKAKRLQEYREMILRMKKEKRQKEVEADLKAEEAPKEKLSEEDQKKLSLRKQLADKLKSKLNVKK